MTTTNITPLITGIVDVHHHDPDGDYPKAMDEGGLVAVIHKATQGRDWVDREFASAMTRAMGVGLMRGAYHFGSNSAPGEVQADFFLATVFERGGEAPEDVLLALDFESNPDRKGGDMTADNARRFVTRVRDVTGRWPLFYTGASRLRKTVTDPGDVLGQCPLWVAAYGNGPGKIPAAWPTWSLWQYTDYAWGPNDQQTYPRYMPGFGKVDRSAFRGTLAELAAWWVRCGR